MTDIDRNPEYTVPRVITNAIVEFVRSLEFKSIHYLGYADDELIKSLIQEGRYTLSLMDYFDRHHRESIGFCEEEGIDHSDLVVPDWLDGIPTYIEGAPPHEILLQDIPWLGGQFDRMSLRSAGSDAPTQFVSMALGGENNTLEVHRGVRNAPLCIVLFGEAQLNAPLPGYDWQEINSLRIGLRKGVPQPRRRPAYRDLFGE